jgi:hypothetical protein
MSKNAARTRHMKRKHRAEFSAVPPGAALGMFIRNIVMVDTPLLKSVVDGYMTKIAFAEKQDAAHWNV